MYMLFQHGKTFISTKSVCCLKKLLGSRLSLKRHFANRFLTSLQSPLTKFITETRYVEPFIVFVKTLSMAVQNIMCYFINASPLIEALHLQRNKMEIALFFKLPVLCNRCKLRKIELLNSQGKQMQYNLACSGLLLLHKM